MQEFGSQTVDFSGKCKFEIRGPDRDRGRHVYTLESAGLWLELQMENTQTVRRARGLKRKHEIVHIPFCICHFYNLMYSSLPHGYLARVPLI